MNPTTLRQWERRYGAPFATKLGSGHRRYTWLEVERMRCVKRAVEAGFKPSQVLLLNQEELNKLLDGGKDAKDELSPTLLAARQLVVQALQSVREQRLFECWRRFDAYVYQHGWYSFVDHVLMPALRGIGDARQRQDLSEVDERAANRVVLEFLNNYIWEFNKLDKPQSGYFLLVTVPGAERELDMKIIESFLVLAGKKVTNLRTGNSLDDIVAAVVALAPHDLCVTLPDFDAAGSGAAFLEALAAQMPMAINIITGGRSVPSYGLPDRVMSFASMASLRAFIHQRDRF